MVAALIEFTKLIGGPGSIRLLLLLIAVGTVWVVARPRRQRDGIAFLVAVGVAHGAMAMPAVATLAVSLLPASEPAADEELRHIQTLFFFDGDNRWGRLREFERIDRAAHPRMIHLLGRLSVYKDLRLMGVSRDRIRHDETSSNTADQVRLTKTLLAGTTGPSAILVSRLQAPRVRLLAERAGVTLPILAAPLDEDPPTTWPDRLVPSLGSLAVTRDAVYELAALRYYGQ